MTVDLPSVLVAALRIEYPGCLNSAAAVADMVDAIVSNHLSSVRTGHRLVSECRPVAAEHLAFEPSTRSRS